MPASPAAALPRPFLRKVWISPCALLLLVLNLGSALAAADQPPQPIRSVFVSALDTANSTDELRRALIKRLKKNGALVVATSENTADAVLRVQSVIWPVGTISLNPRSNSNVVTNYEGYASAELSDQSSQALWSYLATPSRNRFTSITDDLAG